MCCEAPDLSRSHTHTSCRAPLSRCWGQDIFLLSSRCSFLMNQYQSFLFIWSGQLVQLTWKCLRWDSRHRSTSQMIMTFSTKKMRRQDNWNIWSQRIIFAAPLAMPRQEVCWFSVVPAANKSQKETNGHWSIATPMAFSSILLSLPFKLFPHKLGQCLKSLLFPHG